MRPSLLVRRRLTSARLSPAEIDCALVDAVLVACLPEDELRAACRDHGIAGTGDLLELLQSAHQACHTGGGFSAALVASLDARHADELDAVQAAGSAATVARLERELERGHLTPGLLWAVASRRDSGAGDTADRLGSLLAFGALRALARGGR